jgi:UDPglucose--hexose-1-phosphate uridylyltransferase
MWEERWHPLREEWIIVAAHRQDRPWIGEQVATREAAIPPYDPTCYLCPGNVRVSGLRNPQYETTFVFDNDHPCVGNPPSDAKSKPAGIYVNRPAVGVARVVCYSPRHDLALAQLETADVDRLLAVWQEQYRELGSRPEIDHVLVFENKGEVVGVSNPHPHCQIYATNFVFKTIETEASVSERHLRETGRVLFQQILDAEKQDGRRIIAENDTAVAFVPYFARYAYETLVAPKTTHASLATLSDAERADLASVLHETLVRFDNLWQMPFPYVMVLHQAPTDGRRYPAFHFHIEFHPPLRKPHLLKYLAGPEIGGGNFLSDTAPEAKAAELRAVPAVHYTRMVAGG